MIRPPPSSTLFPHPPLFRSLSANKKIIPAPPRPLRLAELPASRRRRYPGAGGALDINERPAGQPAPPCQHPGSLRQQVRRKRGIEKYNVERLRAPREEPQSIGLHDRATARAPLGEPGPQLTHGGRVSLDKRHTRGAARQGLETKRAAAREKIEAARSRPARAEPVEQRLAYAVPRWADCGRGGGTQLPAAPPAADDAQHARVAGSIRRDRGAPAGFSSVRQAVVSFGRQLATLLA